MFIRFKKRRLRTRHGFEEKPGMAFYAVLVENRRCGSAVRQHVIRHLADITEAFLEAPAHQKSFWERVDWHLEDLAVTPEAKKVIEGKLLQVVPRPPSGDEYKRAVKERELEIMAEYDERRARWSRSAHQNPKLEFS